MTVFEFAIYQWRKAAADFVKSMNAIHERIDQDRRELAGLQAYLASINLGPDDENCQEDDRAEPFLK